MNDRAAWEDALQGIAHGFTHTWHHCHAISLSTGDRPALWFARAEGTAAVCPLVERAIGSHIDITTPPGVAGFAGHGGCDELTSEWRRFVNDRGYVAGYIALHPAYAPDCWRSASVRYNTLFFLDLHLPIESLQAAMDRNRRRELRAFEACRNRLVTDRSRLAGFLVEHYPAFAARVGLEPSARWQPSTIAALCDAPDTLLLGVDGPGGIVVAHLYGFTKHGAEFLLQVAHPEGREHTTGLVWEAVQALQARRIPLLNLGGGVHENDAIAQAKQRMGAMGRPLSALREVYDGAAYAALTGASADAVPSGYFPAYRQSQVMP